MCQHVYREELVHRLRVAFGQGEHTEVRIGVAAEGCSPNVVPYEEIYEGQTNVLGLCNTIMQRNACTFTYSHSSIQTVSVL